MKKLIVFAFLMPFLSFGQNIEISELTGYSKPFFLTSPVVKFNPGFSNQITLNYFFTSHFSFGAFYQLNLWNPTSNLFGLTADAHFKHFSFGANISDINVNSTNFKSSPDGWGTTFTTNIKYSPSITYGVHLGLDQKLTRNIYLKEQTGYNISLLKGVESSPNFFNFGGFANPFPNGSFTQPLNYVYLLVGIACRL